jgi:hypothetical protein
MLSEDFHLMLDPQLGAIPNEIHARFYRPDGTRVCDVVYDELVYCHRIDLRRRLVVDNTTVPLAELLLSKLQIVNPAEKDLFDTIALILDHEFDSHDGDAINLPIVIQLCSLDWSLEHTIRLSICRTCLTAIDSSSLDLFQKSAVAHRLIDLLDALERSSKSFQWRLRGLRGCGSRWYNLVETLPDPDPADLRFSL